MTLKSYIQKAYRERFAIGAFAVYNVESIQALRDAANESKKPVIMMLNESSFEYAGFDELVFLAQKTKKESNVPIFLHFDHGRDLEVLKQCVKNKFDSVMFDGSKLPTSQNIAISKELRRLCHKSDVLFEAEIGEVGGREDKVISCGFKTDPQEALNYYEEVKPDMLAVAFGNIHGEATGEEVLDFSLLAKISDLVQCPLVMHGCSNRQAKEYKVAASVGVIKINISTELKESFVDGVKKALKHHESDPRKILSYSINEIKERIKKRITDFSCSTMDCTR